MCGILFTLRLVASTLDIDDPTFDALLTAVTPRGPDSLKIHVSHVTLAPGQVVEVKLAASVLGLRGHGVTSQPLEDEDGVLAWNGQVFQGMDIGVEENDTAKLFQQLKHEALDDVLASIEGPSVLSLSRCILVLRLDMHAFTLMYARLACSNPCTS